MNSSKSQSRWKQIDVCKSSSYNKSRKSQSRYNPKRSQQESQKNFTLPHLHQYSSVQGLDNDRIAMKEISKAIHPEHTKSLSDGKQKVSEEIFNIINHSGGKFSQVPQTISIPKNKRILQKKIQREYLLNEQRRLKRDPLDDNFKDYLALMQKMQQQLKLEQQNVTESLDHRQQQIESIKNNIMLTFYKHLSKFQDPTLQKVIVKNMKEKSNNKQFDTQKAIFERISSQRNIDSNFHQDRKALTHSLEDHIEKCQLKHSAPHNLRTKTGQNCRGTFDRIFQTLEMMKQGLSQFKDLGVIDKKRKQRKISFSLKKQVI